MREEPKPWEYYLDNLLSAHLEATLSISDKDKIERWVSNLLKGKITSTSLPNKDT